MRYVLLLFVLLYLDGSAQNLASNPGFEENTECPCGRGSWPLISWFGQTTYYNRCSVCQNNRIPDHIDGRALPYEGDAYTFVATHGVSFYGRSFIGSKLIQPLEQGKKYYASFRTVSGTPNWEPRVSPTHCTRYYSNKLGMGFSTDSLPLDNDFSPNKFPPAAPKIWTEEIIEDTLNWLLIRGTFTAVESYGYLYIGNFFPEAETQYKLYPAPTHIFTSWYFIDDVKLYEVPVPVVSNLDLCPGDTIWVSSVSQEPTFWELFYPDGSIDGLLSSSGYLIAREPADSLKYSVVLGDSTFTAVYYPKQAAFDKPRVDISGDYCRDSLLTLSAVTDMANIRWSTGEELPAIQVSMAGRYSFRSYTGLCLDSAFIDLEVPDCNEEYYIPNAFTPDGDFYNDVFTVSVNPELEWQLIIFDRWGAEVTLLNNDMPVWVPDASDVPQGVYTYRFNIINLSGQQHSHQGRLMLLR